MGRNWQVFAAPGGDEPLVGGPHPWIQHRSVYIPLEHWGLLLDRAQLDDAALTQRLELVSGSVDPLAEEDIEVPDAELSELADFVDALADRVESGPDLTDQPTPEIPDAYTSEEHARMLRSVGLVFRESLRTGRPARSWKE